MLVLYIGLFISLFILLYLILIPTGIYQTSPAGLTIDAAKRQLENRLIAGNKGIALSVTQKSLNEVIKIALVVGLGLGVLTLVLGLKLVGVFAIPLAIAVTIGGMLLTEQIIQNEFKMWQAKIMEGTPTLVNFVPAFLEIGTITPREALSMTLPFLQEPLKTEVWTALDKINRTGRVQDALTELSGRVKHPVMDAICTRLISAWDHHVSPDIFDDLTDQIEDMKEIAATQATAAKSGFLALLCVFGLLGACLVFGYPGLQWMSQQMSRGFGM